jgi:phosphinothricin acetyltransferase
MAYAATYRPRPAYDGTRETSVYVAADARGRGLGRALYDELLQRVDADGIHVCLAVIALPNPSSEALHAAVGFEHVGTLREVGRKFDRWVDTAWWQRLRPVRDELSARA